MKRILQNSFGKTILCLLVALMSGGTAWANSEDYYSAVRASVIGEGKVYVSKNNPTNNPDYQENSQQQIETNSNQTHNYYLYAQANDGYYFVGWYLENSSGTGNPNSTASPFHVQIQQPGHGSGNIVIQNYYAKFEEFAPITFDAPEGSYYSAQNVVLSCGTPDVTIQYSLNNENNWQNYREGTTISVTANTTIYARARKTVGEKTFTSTVSSAVYTILPKQDVVFAEEISIPYGTPYTLKIGTCGTAVVKTDGSISSVSVTGNDKIASVSGSTITPLAVGTTAITVTSAEGDTYLAGGPAEITINVTAPEGVATVPSGEYTETYKIPASGYGTYCSQYPIDFTRSFTNGETAYTVKEKTETLVRLHLIEQTSIKGGVGFVVKGEPETTVTFRFTNSSNVPTPNMLFGTTAPTYIEYEAAYGMKGGGFHLNNAGVVPAHRAFIPNGSAGSVKALTLEFEEEDPTGIEEFKFEDDSNAVIYNLSGQRINKMQRGINIVNGKKIMVK